MTRFAWEEVCEVLIRSLEYVTLKLANREIRCTIFRQDPAIQSGKMRNSGKIFLTVGLFALTFLSANCGTSSVGGPGPSTADPVRIALVPPGFTSPFHVAVQKGAEKAAKELGWQLDAVAAEREDDFAGQVAVFEQEIQKGVRAIAVNPIDSGAIANAVKKANSAKIPVLMHNMITPVDAGDVTEYIGYDQWSGAAKLGAYACELLHGKGYVFILTGIPGFHTNRRTGGFKWGLEKQCPDVRVVGEQTAEWEREEGVNVAAAALQQHPEINLFYGNSDEMDIGACIAAKKLGRKINQDIYCIGIDGNPVTLDLIAKGDLTATLGVYPEKIGETLVQQMEKVMRQEAVPRILETPSLVVTRENLDEYKSAKTWTTPIEGKPELDNGLPTGEQ